MAAESLCDENIPSIESLPNDNDNNHNPNALEDRVDHLENKLLALQNENDTLKCEFETYKDVMARDISNLIDKIRNLRERVEGTDKITNSKIAMERAERIRRYLGSMPDHKATFETLRGHLGLDKARLNEAIKILMDTYPGRYVIIKSKTDKRRRILIIQ